jgi:hypothetical protein
MLDDVAALAELLVPKLARGDLLRPPLHSLRNADRIEAKWPPLDVDPSSGDTMNRNRCASLEGTIASRP